MRKVSGLLFLLAACTVALCILIDASGGHAPLGYMGIGLVIPLLIAIFSGLLYASLAALEYYRRKRPID